MYKIRYKDEVHIVNPLIEYKYYMEYTNNYVWNIDEIRENINDYYEGHLTYEELEENVHILDKDRIRQIDKLVGLLNKEDDMKTWYEIVRNIKAMMIRELSVYQYMEYAYEKECRRLGEKKITKDKNKSFLEDLKKYLESYIEDDESIDCYYRGYINYGKMISKSQTLYPERKSIVIKLEEIKNKVLSRDEKNMLTTYLKAINVIEADIDERLGIALLREIPIKE